MSKNIKLTRTVKASPEEVYIALTNPLTIQLWTGYPAKMSTEPGTEFSIFEDEISGVNLEFKENELIKQMWFFGDTEEDSIVTINLYPDKKHTKLIIDHINIPDDAHENILYGWKEYYIGGLKSFFEMKDAGE
ncbi:MAG: SRPBCC domain-containing protein [Bacteroidota bacterium]